MTFESFKELALGLFPSLTPEQIEQFREMEAVYTEWNARINVISRKDMDHFYDHHVLHSLAIALYWGENPSADTVLDLGTGGGFPGIPLAVMYPQLKFTLCDSIGKKVKVAGAVADALGLTNVTVINARAESLPEKYDFVVSRAVTSLDKFYPWIKDKVKRGVFYLKGGDVNEEIATMMAQNRLPKGSVHVWPVDSELKDEYFSEKFVIHIEKSYLCSPKSEN